jgi:glutaminyl-peptide cyclotransferase
MQILIRTMFVATVLAAALSGAGCDFMGGAKVTKPAAEAASSSSTSTAPVKSSEPAPPPAQTGGFDGQRAYDATQKLVSFGPRPPDSDALHHAQQYIHAELQSYGCAVEEDDFHASTPVGSVAMKNIVAKTPGEKPGVILLLTHYDTRGEHVTKGAGSKDNFVGAVDGGSSTGLMLEMARVLCPRKSQDAIWIAFLDGEEAIIDWTDTDSTYGSRELAARLALSGDLKKIKAVVLADMVGPYNPKFERDSNSTPWLTDVVWKTAARLGYKNAFISESTGIEDDHLPFLHRDVPSVDIIDLIDYQRAGNWHTPQDTMDKVSARSLAIVGHVILESVNQIEKRN